MKRASPLFLAFISFLVAVGNGSAGSANDKAYQLENEDTHRNLQSCPCENLEYPAMDTIVYNHRKIRSYKDAKLAIANARKGKRTVFKTSTEKIILTRTSVVSTNEECTGCTRFEIFGTTGKNLNSVTVRCCGDSFFCGIYRGTPTCKQNAVGPPPAPPRMPPPPFICAPKSGPKCDGWEWCAPGGDTCGEDESCVSNPCPPPQVPKYCGLVDSKDNLHYCDWKTDCTEDPTICPSGSQCMEHECSPQL